MVQIPATLTAKAQVMSVDATGTPVAVYGPGKNSTTIIDNTNPVMGEDHTATLVFNNLEKVRIFQKRWKLLEYEKP